MTDTSVGNALLASLPAGLAELRINNCPHVTVDARLDRLAALRVLHATATPLAPAALAACRARGCAVFAAGLLVGHQQYVRSLAVLADGRLASGDEAGGIRLWDVAAGAGGGEEAATLLVTSAWVFALAPLPDGRRLAAGLLGGCIEVWDVGVAPPVCRTTVDCGADVTALAVLNDGRLAAGCDDGKVRVVDVDAGGGAVVAAVLEGHSSRVTALVSLPGSGGGALASASWDASVRVWDAGTRVCVATLAGHPTARVIALVVLADGRLASGAHDGAVRLWDVGTAACVGVLDCAAGAVTALAALPDGRLACAACSWNTNVWLWDTRSAAAVGATTRAAAAAPLEPLGTLPIISALMPLPDGRLACAGGELGGGTVYLLDVPPPPPPPSTVTDCVE